MLLLFNLSYKMQTVLNNFNNRLLWFLLHRLLRHHHLLRRHLHHPLLWLPVPLSLPDCRSRVLLEIR
jgi:hypothetical protein